MARPLKRISLKYLHSFFIIFGLTLLFNLFFIPLSPNVSAFTHFKPELNPIISISSPEELDLELVPNANGAFTSGSLDVNVSTNALKGYELYISSLTNSTHMKQQINPNDETNIVSSNFTGSVNSTTMQNNSWGYSLDNTDFTAIPKKDSATKIKDITGFPTAADLKTTVHFGAKLDTTIPSGHYIADILFTAVAHDNPAKNIHTIATMQEMTPEICNALTTPTKAATQLDTDGSHKGDKNYVPTNTLIDTRDNSTYVVSKLADGKCWMTQDLRIINKTITPADSDVTSNYTIPASSISGFNSIDIPSAYMDPSKGGYYNWQVATAGTGTKELSTDGQKAQSSICPKGWRLPTGGNYGDDSDFQVLYEAYPHYDKLSGAPVNFSLGFAILDSSGTLDSNLSNGGIVSAYWSNTNLDNNEAYFINLDYTPEFDSKDVWFKTWEKREGIRLRCVAR